LDSKFSPNTEGAGIANEKLPKSFILRKTEEFRKVFDVRQSAADGVLIVFTVPNELEHCRLGLSVSKKAGCAPVRNRWKRVLREVFRKNRNCVRTALDIVVVPQKGRKPPTEREAEHSFLKLIEKIAKRQSSK
jgi:ribonuclease P protein component